MQETLCACRKVERERVRTGESCTQEGEESETEGGLSSESGTGGEQGGRSGEGRSRLVPREEGSRTAECPGGSDRLMPRTWMEVVEAVCSTNPILGEP